MSGCLFQLFLMKILLVCTLCAQLSSPPPFCPRSSPKPTREMPKSQTLISPLRLNLVKNSANKHDLGDCRLPTKKQNDQYGASDLYTKRVSPKTSYISTPQSSRLPCRTFLVAKSRCRMPPVAETRRRPVDSLWDTVELLQSV